MIGIFKKNVMRTGGSAFQIDGSPAEAAAADLYRNYSKLMHS